MLRVQELTLMTPWRRAQSNPERISLTIIRRRRSGRRDGMPDGRQGAMLRAYDKTTGKEMGAVYMPAGQTGTPMTYMLNGKQYIVVAIAGQNYSAELLAFRLPN